MPTSGQRLATTAGAAQALAEGLTLVTHNTRHFEQVVGLELVDWMTDAPVVDPSS